MTEQYGECGFVPTVENIRKEQGTLVLETIDRNQETNLISTDGSGLKMKGELLTEQQEETIFLEGSH
jgi:hypothetical protein